jgi:hypothetical protein
MCKEFKKYIIAENPSTSSGQAAERAENKLPLRDLAAFVGEYFYA